MLGSLLRPMLSGLGLTQIRQTGVDAVIEWAISVHNLE